MRSEVLKLQMEVDEITDRGLAHLIETDPHGLTEVWLPAYNLGLSEDDKVTLVLEKVVE